MIISPRNTIFILGLSCLVHLSCSKNQITLPPAINTDNLAGTSFISDTVMKKMEGVYELSQGNNALGTEFVCKTSKHAVSFFSNVSGIFFILNYGLNPADGSLQFAGFWRYSEFTTQGIINLSVTSTNGAGDFLLTGNPAGLIIEGSFRDKNGATQAITIKFGRPFTQYVITHEFEIYAHHGVQTTANPPYAENSILGVLHDEDYGVNGLEFDIQLTRDHVPICMHDDNIDIRLTQKSPLTGNYSQYTFSFLETFIRLVDGQKIPSLEQCLDAFIDSTNLKYFWMDVKGDPGIFQYLEPVVRNAYARAQSKNRNVIIYADMPSKEVIQEYQAWPAYSDLPTMCELTLQDVIDNHCEYWGPRYSEGLLLDDVAKAHSMGIKVVSWTLNEKNLIINYLQNGQFDGFISDYPAYVVYYFYTMF
jgi:glycerophosphoryl diester phosphodiesterase